MRRVLLALLAAAVLAPTAQAGTSTNPIQPPFTPTVGPASLREGEATRIFLADEKGLFDKQGLNVEIVQFGRGGEAVDAIATGQVQMAGQAGGA